MNWNNIEEYLEDIEETTSSYSSNIEETYKIVSIENGTMTVEKTIHSTIPVIETIILEVKLK